MNPQYFHVRLAYIKYDSVIKYGSVIVRSKIKY